MAALKLELDHLVKKLAFGAVALSLLFGVAAATQAAAYDHHHHHCVWRHHHRVCR